MLRGRLLKCFSLNNITYFLTMIMKIFNVGKIISYRCKDLSYALKLLCLFPHMSESSLGHQYVLHFGFKFVYQ